MLYIAGKPEKYTFLAPDKWKSYGKVYRATMPGHLSASTKWTDGPTKLEFIIRGREMAILQDRVLLATSRLTEALADQTGTAGSFKGVKWGSGIYGPNRGVSLEGEISSP